MQTEKRSFGIVEGCETEFRAGKEFSGFAAVYYDGTPKTEYRLGPDIVERVLPGAFDAVLASGEDVFALYHHREDMILGRRSSGSMTLENTPQGLRYSVPFDATDPVHQTVAAKIRRGDVRGSSVTWKVPESGQSFERRSDGAIVRSIRRVAIMLDVGPTHLPAYSGTSAELRSQLTEEQADAISAMARRALREPPTPIEFYFATRRF